MAPNRRIDKPDDRQPRATDRTPAAWGILVWALGLLGAVWVFTALDARIVKPVSYQVVDLDAPVLALTRTAPLVALMIVGLLFYLRRSSMPGAGVPGASVARVCNPCAPPVEKPCHGKTGTAAPILPEPAHMSAIAAGMPMLAASAAAASWWVGSGPTFVGICLTCIAIAWSIDRLGQGVGVPPRFERWARWAPAVMLAVLLASTYWHAREQANFWRHFLLGYADFGLFTTELEHCLPWKDVGPLRFYDTRMGYHAVFTFYLLVPFYALFRSPIFLMVVGPLLLNLAAIPFYVLAKQRSGSAAIALIVALAWLALPSVSRLPYSNTYGYQSIYMAVPWLASCFCFAMLGRWRWSHACLAGAMLCEETVCGVALGWGVYLFLFGGRRRDGALIAALAVLYLMLCTMVIIPHFDRAGQYTRLHLFGEDPSIQTLVQRLTRTRVPLYLLALTGPMLVGFLRSWRLVVVALPTLSLVLLMHQTDYLNLKYWHHSSILVVLFLAATVGVTRRSAARSPRGDGRGASLGPPLGLLVGALLFHQMLGTSPIAQSRRTYAAATVLHTRHPRMDAVDHVREHFAPSDYVVIATERMAAHFTDYRMVLPAPHAPFEELASLRTLLIFDRSDRWDKINLLDQADQYLARAGKAGYFVVYDDGSVIVLSNDATLDSASE